VFPFPFATDCYSPNQETRSSGIRNVWNLKKCTTYGKHGTFGKEKQQLILLGVPDVVDFFRAYIILWRFFLSQN